MTTFERWPLRPPLKSRCLYHGTAPASTLDAGPECRIPPLFLSRVSNAAASGANNRPLATAFT